MRAFVRKLSMLTVLFSGTFLFVNDPLAVVFRLNSGSVPYYVLQGLAATILVALLARKKLQVF